MMDYQHAETEPDPADASAWGGSGRSKGADDKPERTLRIVNPVSLATVPVPAREWIVEDWLPIGCVTALYGDGGVGKTLLAHQLMTATALGRPWCGMEVTKCRSFALFCEDDEDELHRRQAAICGAYNAPMTDLEAMRWVSGVGEDNALMTFDSEGGFQTPFYDLILKGARGHGARLIVLDTAADLFAGNENDRHQVRRFIGQLNRMAIDLGASVLLNAHPSRTGLASGNLDGGSTAWSNSVRSRWSLARPTDTEGADPALDTNERVLTRRKANYASIGDNISLQWCNGALVPLQGIGGTSMGERAEAEGVFLDLLTKRTSQNVFVSHSTRAGNYAPKVFGRCAERQGYSVRDFEGAMGRLFDAKRIVAESYGRSGDPRQRIAIAKN